MDPAAACLGAQSMNPSEEVGGGLRLKPDKRVTGQCQAEAESQQICRSTHEGGFPATKVQELICSQWRFQSCSRTANSWGVLRIMFTRILQEVDPWSFKRIIQEKQLCGTWKHLNEHLLMMLLTMNTQLSFSGGRFPSLHLQVNLWMFQVKPASSW